MVHTDEPKLGGEQDFHTVEAEAVDFLHQLRRDGIIKSDEALETRVTAAIEEIRRTSVVVPGADGEEPKTLPGIWHHTPGELEHGLRLS